jgi:hypothetical protein
VHIARRQLCVPSYCYRGCQPEIAFTPGALKQPSRFAFSPSKRATCGGGVSNTERRVGVADAVAECSAHFPHGAPDLHCPMCFAERHCVLDRLAPRTEILKRNGSRITVSEDRLDAAPRTPPIFAGARRFALPLISAAVAPKGFAQ